MCKNNVKTLIRYIYKRYTYAKTAICIQNKRKRNSIQVQDGAFYSKTRQIEEFITYLAY